MINHLNFYLILEYLTQCRNQQKKFRRAILKGIKANITFCHTTHLLALENLYVSNTLKWVKRIPRKHSR